jgi:[acyl-carrier-protein] S-malonyltransferase
MAKRTIPGARAISASTPDEVDALLETIGGGTNPHLTGHEGEHLFATERLVVSPAAGVFTPDPAIGPGEMIHAGAIVGRVGDQEVRSPFGGSVMGLIAVDGERVTVSQPIAWLRTA